MADETPAPDEDTPIVTSVPVEQVDPEPDEDTGGDVVQLVSTGWVRFEIAGVGRVRFKPARFGQLKTLTFAADDMLDEITTLSNAEMVAAGKRQDESTALDNPEENPGLSGEVIQARRSELRMEDRKRSRTLNQRFDELRVGWWREAHGLLGVPGETWPADDDLPAWFTDPQLIQVVLGHFRTVPLDRGRK